MIARKGLVAALILLAAGCVSTGDRFKRAEKAESVGLYMEAANLYARTLESDSGHAEARARLSDVGALAITSTFNEVDDLEAGGQFELVVDQMNLISELVRRARDLDVILTPPADFQERNDFYVGAAVDQLIRESEADIDKGNLEGARRTLERARDDYQPDSQRRADVDHRLADVLLGLADLDLDDQRFRSAFDTATRAIEVLDEYNDEDESRARAKAAGALGQGVRVVAMVPFWQTDLWRGTAPPDLRTDVNDAVAFGEANRMSPFLSVHDPGNTRRVVRRMRLDTHVLNQGDMRAIGSELDADFVLAGELVRFTREDKVRRTRTRDTKTRGRGGVDTTYTSEQLDIRFSTELAFRVIDIRTRRIVLEQTLKSSASKRVDRARYPGNWTSLDLSGSEQRLFDPEEWARQDRDIMVELSDGIAADLIRRMDDALIRLID
jgi:tetratricopeptide (TPR) repeat protein